MELSTKRFEKANNQSKLLGFQKLDVIKGGPIMHLTIIAYANGIKIILKGKGRES